MSNITVLMELPTLLATQYEQVLQEMEALGLIHPKGRLYHVISVKDQGFIVVDIWESAELFNEFVQVLAPISQKLGMAVPPPQIYQVHNIVQDV
jgi:hypothetical protein